MNIKLETIVRVRKLFEAAKSYESRGFPIMGSQLRHDAYAILANIKGE